MISAVCAFTYPEHWPSVLLAYPLYFLCKCSPDTFPPSSPSSPAEAQPPPSEQEGIVWLFVSPLFFYHFYGFIASAVFIVSIALLIILAFLSLNIISKYSLSKYSLLNISHWLNTRGNLAIKAAQQVNLRKVYHYFNDFPENFSLQFSLQANFF